MIGQRLVDHLSRVGKLSAEDCGALFQLAGEHRTFKRNEDIVKAGASPSFSVVVVTGFIQRYVSRRDGSRQIHSFYIAGDAPTLESVNLGYADSNLSAAVASEVVVIPDSDLHEVMRSRPRIRELVWRSGLIQSACYREWLTRNSRLCAHAAMAHLFCEIYARSMAAGVVDERSCHMPLTQEILGDALGLTGVHVNRTLQQLRDTGLVDHCRGRLFVHDFEGLANLSDFDPAYLYFGEGRDR